jgi:hypothetical protein
MSHFCQTEGMTCHGSDEACGCSCTPCVRVRNRRRSEDRRLCQVCRRDFPVAVMVPGTETCQSCFEK